MTSAQWGTILCIFRCLSLAGVKIMFISEASGISSFGEVHIRVQHQRFGGCTVNSAYLEIPRARPPQLVILGPLNIEPK